MGEWDGPGEGATDRSPWLSLACSNYLLAGSVQKGFDQAVLDRSSNWQLDRGFRSDVSRPSLRAASRPLGPQLGRDLPTSGPVSPSTTCEVRSTAIRT